MRAKTIKILSIINFLVKKVIKKEQKNLHLFLINFNYKKHRRNKYIRITSIWTRENI